METPTASDELISSSEISERLVELKQRIDQAAQLAGRSASDIAILSVTKTHPPNLVHAAYASGLRDFGENYVQEALAKQDELPDLADARWHYIGHLQSNKTNVVDGRFALIQSIDSLKLAERIGRSAAQRGAVQDVLIQIKLGGEATKSGVAPQEVLRLCEELSNIAGLRAQGIMAIAPLADDGYLVKEPQPFFAQAREVFESLPPYQRQILSMGMSADYETAIAEGSTMIRVGTTLFGPRPPSLHK